MTVVMKVAEQE